MLVLLLQACGAESEVDDGVMDGADTVADGAMNMDADAADAAGETGDAAEANDAVGASDTNDANDANDAEIAVDTDDAEGADVPDEPGVAMIDEVLDCGTNGTVGGLAATDSVAALERHALDTTRFADALCNDGSAAVVYIRPASRAEDVNRWVIELMGGGGCNTMEACSNRWCSVGTNFSRTQMTSLTSPERTRGTGILVGVEEGEVYPNPWAGWNHVLVKYCSSDTWRGTARDVVISAPHPRTSEPVQFRMHFLGRRILEATIATLRADGVAPLTWGRDGVAMPDLDNATEVVFAGASAGGGGVTFNLDWLAAELASHNPGVFVSGLIDSTFGPDLTGLDFTNSVYCTTRGLCSAEAFLGSGREAQDTLWRAVPEESCDAAHGASGELWRCASDTFVMLQHLTTPFFVRQGLSDGLISEVYVEGGVRREGVPIDLRAFGGLVREHLREFATLPETALEGDSMTVAPGGFGPACSKHETLRSNPDTFEVTISPAAGEALTMFEVWQRWRDGGEPSIVVTNTADDTRCAD
jgi:hypothetical protein